MADVELLRSDLGAFADAAGCPLTERQAASLKLETRFTAILANRQAGKSRSLGMLALWWAFRERGQRVLVVSAGEDAARRLLAEIRRVAMGSPLLAGSVVDENAGLLTLTNGSEIRSVPSSDKQIRGWTVDLLLVDEAPLVSDELLEGAAIPTTAARPEARIVLAGSPLTAAGFFYDTVKRGEGGSEHTRTHRWALADCPWISPTAIQSARESMSPARFAAEYLGEFSDGADALFTRAALDRVTADYYAPPLSELTGPARLLAGVDWGLTVDRSVLVAIARLPEAGEVRFGVCCVRRWPAGAPLTNPGGVIPEIVSSPAHFARITAELNGLGGPLCETLFRRLQDRHPDMGGGRRAPMVIDPQRLDEAIEEYHRRREADRAWGRRGTWHTVKSAVHTTPGVKAAIYSSLRMLIEREALLIPESAVELRRELLTLRVDLNPSGSEKIEAASGHDDVADATALALGPRKTKRGWRTILADLADPANADALPPPSGAPLADGPLDDLAREAGYRPPLPRREGPTVRTGSGIELPRQPLFQSVAGSEVTGLDVQVEAEKAVTRRGRFLIERNAR